MRSAAAWLACATPETVDEFLGGLGDAALMALPWLFEFWALPHQLPPEGVWKTWVIMGGRGAGKTRAGAEWVRAEVEGARPLDPGRSRRVALLGETLEQVQKVMIFGESGMFSENNSYAVTAVAATRARVARIANRDYLSVLRECPAACLSMLGQLADRVGRHVQQIECTTLDPATDRLVRLIEDRMPSEGDGPHVVRFDETRQELASFLSMKPETLSRVLRHLGAGGVVVVRGRDVHVPSRGRLLSLLGGALQ